MRTIDLRGTDLSPSELRARLPRAEVDIEVATGRVTPILAAVRAEGGAALRRFTEEFDRIAPHSLRVPREILAAAPEHLDPDVRDALLEAIRRARLGHEAQLPADRTTVMGPGALVHQRWVPVRRVGLYVPGGLAAYPSSVVMNVVAAQVAGVASLAVASPPQKDNDGWPDATILAACELLGVREVYAVGGAQAVGMFAYGVAGDADDACEPVDVVTGSRQRLCRRRQARRPRRRRDRRRGGDHRDRRAGGCHRRPGLCRGRPRVAGGARSRRCLGAGDRLARAGRRRRLRDRAAGVRGQAQPSGSGRR